MNRGAKLGLAFGLAGAALGLGLGVLGMVLAGRAAGVGAPGQALEAGMDARGPYAILATEEAAASYARAIEEAKELHPGAEFRTFPSAAPEKLLPALRENPPRYALVFALPGEIDVNFAWRWLALAAQIDDDPFVDVRTGIITGQTPEAALAFVRRIARAARGESRLPGLLVDNLGPNPQAPKGSCLVQQGSFMLPVYGRRVAVRTISHGPEGFTAERLAGMEGAGLVHYGGHGYPDRVVDSLNAPFLRRIRFAPCAFFNGACYTGVTGAWYDLASGTARRKTVEPPLSFCLAVLGGEAVGYLAALHPDHGIPVYQEMEFLAWSGEPLGEVLKATHDGVVLGAGGRLPELAALRDGEPAPRSAPAEVMLRGTAARVLYGDPALKVLRPFTDPPFRVTAALDGRTLKVQATLQNPELKSTFTETYYSDMSKTGQFNDRALVACDLPAGLEGALKVRAVKALAGGRPLECRLVGYAVERDGGARRLHVLIDLPSTGYQQGPFRAAGSTVSFEAVPE